MYVRRPFTLELHNFFYGEPIFIKNRYVTSFKFSKSIQFMTSDLRGQGDKKYKDQIQPTFLKFGMWDLSVILSPYTP